MGGSALILGALVGYYVRLPQRLIAGVMAIGSGVLISAVLFDLIDEAFDRGDFAATALGFVGGAAAYTLANVLLFRRGAKHRKRWGSNPEAAQPEAGTDTGLAIAVVGFLVAFALSKLGG